ncbi:hypothetical protein GUJ93_ZPchr0012g19712 [Zizania palustris]|uniref:Uncharacterized protein n=1 Tax=Zizania palustris TaxID=103762 RepID=A0A8J5WMH3_ZIZPA|nr:hypothetical protein GUJ93_ZPchr0012g19712 [Zizania palustris]
MRARLEADVEGTHNTERHLELSCVRTEVLTSGRDEVGGQTLRVHPCELRSSLHPRLQHPPVASTLPVLTKSASEELRAAVDRSRGGASGTAVHVRRFGDGARAEQAAGLRRRCGLRRVAQKPLTQI